MRNDGMKTCKMTTSKPKEFKLIPFISKKFKIKKAKMGKASITVFLSLLTILFIGFIMAMTEHARIFGLRQRLTSATDSAMDSLFSMYDCDLLDEFDLLLLNEANLKDSKESKDIVEHYLTMNLNSKLDHLLLSGSLYMGNNVSVEIENTVSVIENEGELFARSVLEFMKYRTLGIALEKVQEQLEDIKKGEDARTEAQKEQDQGQENVQKQLAQKTEEEQEQYREVLEESWLDKIEKLKEDGWLNFVMPFDQAASDYTITSSDLPSKWRTVNFTWYHSAISEIEESFLFTEYLLEHCRCFTSAEKTEGMAYELEYVLNGKVSDKENLKSTVNSLLLMREGLNLFSALKDSTLSSQAQIAATALVGWTGIYPAVKLTQFAMLAGWSFAEAIVDVRTLLSGGRIPIIKNAESWTLSFSQIADFLDGDLFLTAKEQDGLTYDSYLRLLLYAKGRSDRRYYTMDVIQLRMRENNPSFSMTDCLGAVEVCTKMTASPIFYNFGGKGYKLSCSQSRMY